MDYSFKRFFSLSGLLIVAFFSLLVVFGFFYKYSTMNTYNIILLFLIFGTILIILFYILCWISILVIYKNKSTNPIVLKIARTGSNFVLPLLIILSGVFKHNKDIIRKFYIDFNNLLISSNLKKYKSQDILVLLPHCLQYSECGYKITRDISNCRECGRCPIGEVKRICEKNGVNVYVVTGGTFARNVVKDKRPKLIFAVACERDLTSGIMDLGKLPVVGLLNERPNGPCYNTLINPQVFEKRLEEIIKN